MVLCVAASSALDVKGFSFSLGHPGGLPMFARCFPSTVVHECVSVCNVGLLDKQLDQPSLMTRDCFSLRLAYALSIDCLELWSFLI